MDTQPGIDGILQELYKTPLFVPGSDHKLWHHGGSFGFYNSRIDDTPVVVAREGRYFEFDGQLPDIGRVRARAERSADIGVEYVVDDLVRFQNPNWLITGYLEVPDAHTRCDFRIGLDDERARTLFAHAGSLYCHTSVPVDLRASEDLEKAIIAISGESL